MNDGLSFKGDLGTINKSLNKTLKITGGQKDASKKCEPAMCLSKLPITLDKPLGNVFSV
ncbi:hypothetical protein [Taylorella equigenitalis]|uniref:hypothetical protein n=1 Tax=Taylorella equigenitalis TaxID=29575 RepID=UPI000A6100EF|nr:hypothetical protein [Taylorella equigenitalis]